MIRRIEPWEIPAVERATVGRVLETFARHFKQAWKLLPERDRAGRDRYEQVADMAREHGVTDVVDELRAYAREILSWSECNGSPNAPDPDTAAAAHRERPE